MNTFARMFAFLAVVTVASGQEPTTLPERLASAALLREFETIARSPSDFVVQTYSQVDSNPAINDPLITLRLPFIPLLAALRSLQAKGPETLLASYNTWLVGAKDFSAPTGLGLYDSRKCYVGVASTVQTSNAVAAGLFRLAEHTALNGDDVWTWQMPAYEGHPIPTKMLATLVSTNYLLIATDQEALIATRRSLSSLDGRRTRPELTLLSEFPFWEYRHFRPSANGRGEELASAVFGSSPREKKFIFSAYAQNAQSTATPTTIRFPDQYQLRLASPGRWSTSFVGPGDSDTTKALYMIAFVMGFGVVL